MIHYGICNFCDSICGLAVEHEGPKIVAIRGDQEDMFSRGHVCPKGLAQRELYHDPDRIKRPLRRRGGEWEEIGWDEALTEAGERLGALQRRYGNDALGVYYGNPTAHNYGSLLLLMPFILGMKTKNVFSATSVDSLTRMLVSLLVYGNQALLPIPDLERTQMLLILGANPVVSNGSVMTAPDCKKRLLDLRARGGKIIVIDPRRTETALIADAHHFIRPGTDALLLLAMLHTIFKDDKSDPGPLRPMIAGLDRLYRAAAEYPPERVAAAVGIGADDIRALAREFAASPTAVAYGRMGTSTQEFGALATWLVDALNIVTGNFDRPGGAMFTTPAVNLAGLAKLLRQPGYFNRWQSRVSGLPEFNGEFPVAAFAEEMETPGPGQVKALIVMAGNPVLSLPNGPRLSAGFERLEYMVAIDFYLNETTRHAHLILPPTTLFETDHYSVLEHAMGIRNTAHYAPALFPKPAGAMHNWEIQLDLLHRIEKNRGGIDGLIAGVKHAALRAFGPERQLNLLLRLGPHKLSVKKLKGHPHGLDLGPLEPRIEQAINTKDRKINLAPEVLLPDLDRLNQKLAALDRRAMDRRAPDEFLLISRRTLKSMNSWLHNLAPLVKGKARCTVQMNPADADRLELSAGRMVTVSSRVGRIQAPLEITDQMMPGVLSMAFGWGHDRPGARLSVAREHAGVSMNDLVDEKLYDRLSGISVLDGIPVKVE
jgi:anaerobic selenocysteine-containing dehydrogenase